MKEADLQIQLVEFLELVKDQYGFMFFSVPNELMGKARTSAGLARMAKFRKMGLRHGVADLVIIKKGRVFFLELKAPKGKQSENQILFEKEAVWNNAFYSVAYSFEEALSILKDWSILP